MKDPNENQMIVYDPYKAAFIWWKTQRRPTLVQDPQRDRIIFKWEGSTDQIQTVIDDYLSGDLKVYIELFKSLRSEMYLLKGNGK